MADPFVGEIRAFAFNYVTPGWALCNGQLLSVSTFQALFALISNVYGGDGRTTFALPNLCGRMIVGAGTPAQQSPGNPTVINNAQYAGSNSVNLSLDQLPNHTHTAAVTDPGHNHSVSVPAHTHPFAVPCDTTGSPTTASPVGAYPSSTVGVDTNLKALNVGLGGLGGSATLTQPTPLYSASGNGSMAPGTTGQSATAAGTSGSSLTYITVENSVVGSNSAVPIQPPLLGIGYYIALTGIFPPRD